MFILTKIINATDGTIVADDVADGSADAMADIQGLCAAGDITQNLHDTSAFWVTSTATYRAF